jgi:transposase
MIPDRFFTDGERLDLRERLRVGTQEHRVGRRINALLLLDQGMSCAEVGRVLFLDDDTIRDFYKLYSQGGIDAIEAFDLKGGMGFLSTEHKEKVVDFVKENHPRHVGVVNAFIKETANIEYASKSSLSKMLGGLNIIFNRPKPIPRGLNVEKQDEFISKIEKVQENLPANEVLLSTDAVHPQHAARPSGCWTLAGETVVLPQASARDRLNVQAALNPETGQMVTVTAKTIDRESFIELLKAILLAYPTMVMIHLILDNARYHHAKDVKKWVEENGNRFTFYFLPAYSPHLNWIERVWYLMHKYVTHNQCHDTFKQFSEAILKTLNETIPQNWAKHRKYVVIPLRTIDPKKFRVVA